MKNGLKAAAVFAVVAAVAPVARAQMTGVSHPEQIPVTPPTTSQDDTAVPMGYQPTPQPAKLAVTLKTRPEDGAIVGDNPPVGYTTQPLTPRYEAYAPPSQPREYVSTAPHEDVDGMIVMDVPGPPNQLPVGTLLKARILEQFSTTGTSIGSEFSAELSEPVERNGRVLLPAGSLVTGHVTDVHGGRRISGAASLHLQPTEITMPDGLKYRIYGQVVDTTAYHDVKVDNEGTIVRRDHAGKTLAVLGLATGSGAAAGGLIAGVPGAVVGGLVGAGVGTTVWLKQDRQTEIKPGTGIIFALNQPLTVGNE